MCCPIFSIFEFSAIIFSDFIILWRFSMFILTRWKGLGIIIVAFSIKKFFWVLGMLLNISLQLKTLSWNNMPASTTKLVNNFVKTLSKLMTRPPKDFIFYVKFNRFSHPANAFVPVPLAKFITDITLPLWLKMYFLSQP